MAPPSSSRFARLLPWQKLLARTVLVALCAMACSSVSAFIAVNGSAFPTVDVAATSNQVNTQSQLVQALKQEGGYSAAATFLGAMDLNHLLPDSSTILAPMDEGLADSGFQLSSFNTAMPILQYHVIPQRLVFNDLQQLPVGQTLPTLLPDNTIIITSNSSANFTIDDVPISRRNLFVSSNTVVHGMSGILNFALYGKMTHLYNFQPQAPSAKSPASGGPLPAQQIMAPPSSAGNGSNNLTVSPSFSPVNSNFSFPAPNTATPGSETPNASQEASTPLPVPTIGSSHSHPTPPPASVAQVPSNPVQQASPLLHTNCSGGEIVRGLVCVPSGSSHPVKFLKVYRLTFLAFLLSGKHFVAGLIAMPRLPLLCLMLAFMAGTSTMAAENGDVSEVLRSKGGFDYAATYLEAIDMHKVLPNKSTVLVPTDAALEATGLIYNTLGAALPILQYHVLTRELLFKDLQMLPVGEMLETMLPKSSLMVTSNSPQNFTINGVLLSHPDIASINGSAIHGIDGVMNYSRVFTSPLTGTTRQLLAPPLPPELNVLSLPKSVGPFVVPFPVSDCTVLVKESISCRSTLYTVILLSGILFLLRTLLKSILSGVILTMHA